MKVVRLVETVDFDIKIVLIRGHMQPVEAKQSQKQKLQSHFGPTELVWSVSPSWSENLPESWQCWLGRTEANQSVRPSWSEKLQKDTESWQRSLGGTEMNQSVRPSWSGKLPKIPVRVRLGFLMFWTEFLVLFYYGKSSRLINRWEVTADCTTHNRTNQFTTFYPSFYISPLFFLSRSSCWRAAILEALGVSESI